MRIPVNLSVPPSLVDLDRNLSDIRVLLDLVKITKEPRLRRRDAGVLTRSAIVLTCAAWENFVEELALDVLAYSISRIGGELQITGKAREAANRALKHVDISKPYQITVELRRHRDRVLGLFNTPKAANVDSLYRRVFNLDRLTDDWRWARTRTSFSRLQLDRFVMLRSDIAHRSKAPNRISRHEALEFCALTSRLSWIMCNTMRTWLSKAASVAPWGQLPRYATD